MQSILSATTKIVVDQKAGSQNLIYLPLDRLMQMNQGAMETAPRVAAPETPAVPAQPETAPRREGLRSRERDAGR
jgi:membrane protease subunit HflK